MMSSPVFAVSFGEFLGNGWNWAQSNPGWALAILAVVVVAFLVLAGPAGPLPGGPIAIVGYGAASVLISYVLCCVAGTLGTGPGSDPGLGPKLPSPTVDLLIITQDGASELDVEKHYQGTVSRVIRRTWNRYNLETEVRMVCDNLPSDSRVLTIEWVEVPHRLRETIVESFRANGVSVREEVVTP